MAEVPAPETYRGRLAQFQILEASRHALIEELLDKLEKTEAKLQQTELDLQSEQNVRRRLQAETVQAKEREAAWAEKASKRPYVIVLIDADAEGFMFLDKFITKREKGGEAAADELLLKTREYLRPIYEDADKLDILVRIFANQEGMANLLVREGKIRNLGQLRAFSTGFNSRMPSFDFVDTGIGKEGGSGRKLRADTPPPFFRNLPIPLSSITLIESAPIPSTLKSLPDIKTVKFPSLLLPPPPPAPSRSRSGRPQLQLTQQEDRDGGSTWLVIKPERSKSQGAGLGRRGVDDEDSSLSISIGPDNTVKFGKGNESSRRRIMG